MSWRINSQHSTADIQGCHVESYRDLPAVKTTLPMLKWIAVNSLIHVPSARLKHSEEHDLIEEDFTSLIHCYSTCGTEKEEKQHRIKYKERLAATWRLRKTIQGHQLQDSCNEKLEIEGSVREQNCKKQLRIYLSLEQRWEESRFSSWRNAC